MCVCVCVCVCVCMCIVTDTSKTSLSHFAVNSRACFTSLRYFKNQSVSFPACKNLFNSFRSGGQGSPLDETSCCAW